MESEKPRKCLGCGIGLEIGDICYKCLYNGIAITEIHHKYGINRIIAADGKEYAIWIEV